VLTNIVSQVSEKLWTVILYCAHRVRPSSSPLSSFTLVLMSSSVQSAIVNPDSTNGSNEALGQGQPARSAQHKNYKGFVAGVFSGISKLSGTKIASLYQRRDR